eukprot:CAMPEP_0185845738 /NCGR_PEP_ID=MMETSP1354-20130828/1624_1 /TAXON_ID=708628 /ORGANISM="Erythrolobus madagascarensis, Strain CCMP3276" /LENGTH=376 /DNA_ID=CAMNT_0028545773 /DNA_START=308 /DNA_END=1438 /DNA_ORIENTATION=-
MKLSEAENVPPPERNETLLESSGFTQADIRHWAEIGLLSPSQRDEILLYVATNGTVQEQVEAKVEQRVGLNFVSLAYYFGGFMILAAFTIFFGGRWKSLGAGARVGVLSFAMGVLLAVGALLETKSFHRAAALLFFASTGIVPVLVYFIQGALGVWPPRGADILGPIGGHGLFRRLPIALISGASAFVMLHLTRFPLFALPFTFWSWFLSLDFVMFAANAAWQPERATRLAEIVNLLFGVSTISVGVGLQRCRKEHDFSMWLYLFGLAQLFSSLASFTLVDQNPLLSLFYGVTSLAAVFSSIYLQQSIFLVFGASGWFVFLGYMWATVFKGAMSFSLLLSLFGLSVVLSAVAYQRYLRVWLASRVGSLPDPDSMPM